LILDLLLFFNKKERKEKEKEKKEGRMKNV